MTVNCGEFLQHTLSNCVGKFLPTLLVILIVIAVNFYNTHLVIWAVDCGEFTHLAIWAVDCGEFHFKG